MLSRDGHSFRFYVEIVIVRFQGEMGIVQFQVEMVIVRFQGEKCIIEFQVEMVIVLGFK